MASNQTIRAVVVGHAVEFASGVLTARGAENGIKGVKFSSQDPHSHPQTSISFNCSIMNTLDILKDQATGVPIAHVGVCIMLRIRLKSLRVYLSSARMAPRLVWDGRRHVERSGSLICAFPDAFCAIVCLYR